MRGLIPLTMTLVTCIPTPLRVVRITPIPLPFCNTPRSTRTSSCTTLTISPKATVAPRETAISMNYSSEEEWCVAIQALDRKLNMVSGINLPLKRIVANERLTDSEVTIDGRVVLLD